ncbi:tumor protein p63-regulated gene 1-like protein isoform X2 [Orbicella faveolata]|uniref:tumor protein p63-regulated gene 1-like protein isoform X2 n=1 Tax=Orbicella faveolata TaxID=48498 RepID=UPI0009E346B1|nr:tumor protein p63-regulated gene 1-like protein isoform X2 [Orbicella faveolata]
MADGSSLNDLNTKENKPSSPTLMAAQGAEGGNRSSSASDMSNIPIDEVVTVPNVEVKHAPFQSQPNLRGDLTAEQVKELGEKMRKEQAKKYFSLREGAFTNAVEECKLLLDESDGELLSSWLLSEIDHWDHEKERIVLITKKTLCLVKYNFIGLKVDEMRKIPLTKCDKIQVGRFVYPKNTMMIPRHFQTGLRLHFGKNTIPTFLQNWNPWSRAIPFVTFCWHRGNDVMSELPEHMQLDPFQESLISAITDCHNALQEGVAQESLEIVQNEPIMIEVYCGISPIVHNYSIWGFNRDRGKFGF